MYLIPSLISCFSFLPLHANVLLNILATEVPRTGLNEVFSFPAAAAVILSAISLPCLFAGPAIGIIADLPVTKSISSTASPPAHIFSSEVCKNSFTFISPFNPVSKSASLTICVSG